MSSNTIAAQKHRASYKTGKKSEVDETLFAGATKPGESGAAVLSKAMYSNIQALVGEQSAVMSTTELQRMKDTATGEFERQAALKAATAASAKQDKAKQAALRKQKMQELEAQRKLAIPPTEIEAQKMQETAELLNAADRQMAEELDDVKKMNQMMLYSKVVTIRDAQLNEKKGAPHTPE